MCCKNESVQWIHFGRGWKATTVVTSGCMLEMPELRKVTVRSARWHAVKYSQYAGASGPDRLAKGEDGL